MVLDEFPEIGDPLAASTPVLTAAADQNQFDFDADLGSEQFSVEAHLGSSIDDSSGYNADSEHIRRKRT